jgi:hypothetical protein
MTPVRRPLTAVLRLLTALTAATAVAVELLLDSPARVLSDFTVQSALLLALVLALSARRDWTARRPLPEALTGAALLYAVIGGLVHHLLVANPASPFAAVGRAAADPAWSMTIAQHILHTAVPVAAVLDRLLLSVPGRLHLRQASTWMLYPLAYLAFSLARGELLAPGAPDRYLYPFLDAGRHGYKGVLGNALLLGLSFYALAVLLVALDHVRPNPVHRRSKTGFRLQPPVG